MCRHVDVVPFSKTSLSVNTSISIIFCILGYLIYASKPVMDCPSQVFAFNISPVWAESLEEVELQVQMKSEVAKHSISRSTTCRGIENAHLFQSHNQKSSILIEHENGGIQLYKLTDAIPVH
jgi:hypothetical protein